MMNFFSFCCCFFNTLNFSHYAIIKKANGDFMYFYGVLLSKFFQFLDEKHEAESIDFNSKLDYFFENLELCQPKISTLTFYNIFYTDKCSHEGFIGIFQSKKAKADSDILQLCKDELVNNLKSVDLEDWAEFFSQIPIEDLKVAFMDGDIIKL